MATMTLAIPEEIKKKMAEFPEMNWSEVARQAFKQKIEDMEFLLKFKEKSSLTDDESLELGSKVNKEVSNKLRNKSVNHNNNL